MFGTSTRYSTPRTRSIAPITCSASASCGTAFGWTNEVTWISFTPLRERAFTTSILVSVGIHSRSAWKPSRGPTSATVTLLGSCITTSVGGKGWKRREGMLDRLPPFLSFLPFPPFLNHAFTLKRFQFARGDAKFVHEDLMVVLADVHRAGEAHGTRGGREFRHQTRHGHRAQHGVFHLDQVASGAVLGIIEYVGDAIDGADRDAVHVEDLRGFAGVMVAEPLLDDVVDRLPVLGAMRVSVVARVL